MKNLKKRVFNGILFVIITVMISGVMPYHYFDYYIYAKVDTSDAAMKALQDKLAKIQQSKKENQQKIDDREKDLINEQQTKKLLDENIDLTIKEIDMYQSLGIELDNLIRDKEYEIKEIEQDITDDYEVFLESMKASYEDGTINLIEVIFTSKSLPEFMMNVEYASSILNYQQERMVELNVQSEQLRLAKVDLDTKRQEANEYGEAAEQKKIDLDAAAQKSENYLARYRNEIATAEADLESNIQAEKDFNSEMEKIIVERERQKALEKKQTYYTGSGKLLYPTETKYTVGSGYGYRNFDGFHRGIDIPYPFGTAVYAAASGVVVTSDYHYSYGNYIMIDHGVTSDGISLYTLYAHLSTRLVSKDAKVEAGQQIGKGGSSGNSTGNHLHFEVRENGATVDPVAKGYI